MKILMVICRHADTRTLNEARALVEAGNEVTVLGWDRQLSRPREETVDGVKISWIAWKETYGRGVGQLPGFACFWIRVLFRLLRWKYDVVQCENLDALPLGWLVGRLRRKRVVFDAHIPYPDRVARLEQNSRSTRILVRVLETIEQLLARRADIVLTDSEKMVERFRNMGVTNAYEILNVPRRDFVYIPKVHTNDRPVTIGRIGLMSRAMGHGVDDTIDAFERLLEEGYDVRLALFGNITPDSYKEELVARIRGLGDRVTFSDFIPYDEVMKWYGKLDISAILYDLRVHRCMYRLGYPTKLFESMAAAPMILRSNTHAQQLLLDKKCGIVVGYELESVVDGLRTLVEDPELRTRYGENARRAFEERYNWAYETQRLLKAMESVLSPR